MGFVICGGGCGVLIILGMFGGLGGILVGSVVGNVFSIGIVLNREICDV